MRASGTSWRTLLGDVVDVLHAVVHVEHLPLAQELPTDGLGRRTFVVLAHVREDRLAVLGRGVHQRQVANAGQRHLERPRDRSRGERQHVDVGAQLLDQLLVLHAEALLLVDDEQAEVLELDVSGEEPVRRDDDVDRPVLHTLDDRVLLLGREKARQHLDPHRVVREPLAERLAVLVGEQRGRDEHRHLLAVLHRFERGPDRHLRLAVADVAAHEAVHGHGSLHVGLDVLDGLELVGRLLVRERLLDLALPRRVGPEGVARRREPLPVEHDQLLGDLADGRAHPGARLLPVAAAHPVQRGCVASGVAAHGADLIGRDVQLVAAAVLQQQVVALDTADGPLRHPRVATDAVLVVHDEVAGLERVVEVGATLGARGAAVHAPSTGEVGLGDDREPRARYDDAPLERRDHDADLARRDAVDGVDALAGQHVVEAPGRSPARRRRGPPANRCRGGCAAGASSPSVSPTTGSNPAAARCGVVGRLGCGEERRHAGARVREQPIERQREAREVAAVRGAPGHGERRAE